MPAAKADKPAADQHCRNRFQPEGDSALLDVKPPSKVLRASIVCSRHQNHTAVAHGVERERHWLPPCKAGTPR